VIVSGCKSSATAHMQFKNLIYMRYATVHVCSWVISYERPLHLLRDHIDSHVRSNLSKCNLARLN